MMCHGKKGVCCGMAKGYVLWHGKMMCVVAWQKDMYCGMAKRICGMSWQKGCVMWYGKTNVCWHDKKDT